MNKTYLSFTIVASFEVDEEIEGLEVLGEALEKLREGGSAKVTDVTVQEQGK